MQRQRHPSKQARTILALLLDAPREWQYGYELSKETGINAGPFYPILIRLSEQGMWETAWREPDEPGRPKRHVYRLTAQGVHAAREFARSTSRAFLRSARATA